MISKSEQKEEFLKQYVLNASIGAGRLKLNVRGAITEATEAWDIIQVEMARSK
jgi:hypothetical protein